METRKSYESEEQNLLARDEDHYFDFKSFRKSPSDLQPHFIAFANADGGEMYIGIEDKKVIGERISGYRFVEEANDVLRILLNETRPTVQNVDVEFIDFGNRGYVLHITIPKSPEYHLTTSGECFERLNASTLKSKPENILALGYKKGVSSYEKQRVPFLNVEEIVKSPFLVDYMKRIMSEQEKTLFLRKQGLLTKFVDDYYPNIGCVLLFDELPQAALNIRCSIKVYRLRTTEKEYKREYLESEPETIEGPIEQQIYVVIENIQKHLRDASYYDNGKLTHLEYPTETLKEILVNAIIHRDYSVKDDIHVRIFDNRIEVQSPGRLPGHITIGNIFEERFSRNPNIQRMLHNLPNPVNHDIGEGLKTARDAMRKAGLVPPEIIELPNAVLVTIRHQRIASLEDIILRYLKNQEFITNKMVRALSGENDVNKVKKAFQKLRKNGLIEPENEKSKAFDFKYRLKKDREDLA